MKSVCKPAIFGITIIYQSLSWSSMNNLRFWSKKINVILSRICLVSYLNGASCRSYYCLRLNSSNLIRGPFVKSDTLFFISFKNLNLTKVLEDICKLQWLQPDYYQTNEVISSAVVRSRLSSHIMHYLALWVNFQMIWPSELFIIEN